MEAMTIERARTTHPGAMARVVAYVGAAAFAIAAAWYMLAARGVTEASAPRFGPNEALHQASSRYFGWFVTTLQQERIYTSIAIIGFLCLVAVGSFARDLLWPERSLARFGTLTLATGGVVWVVGSVLQLGGHRAVGLMATHANPIETVNAIQFMIDTVADAFALASFAVMGVAMLVFGRAAKEAGGASPAWGRYSLLLGIIFLALSGAYATGNGAVVNILLVATGAVMAPVWLVWTGKLLSRGGGR